MFLNETSALHSCFRGNCPVSPDFWRRTKCKPNNKLIHTERKYNKEDLCTNRSTLFFLSSTFHGQRSLVGCSPQGQIQRVRYNLATKQQQTFQMHHHLPICSLLCFSPFLCCVVYVAPMKPLSFHWAMCTGDWRGRRAELRLCIFSLNSLIKRGGGSMESSSSW